MPIFRKSNGKFIPMDIYHNQLGNNKELYNLFRKVNGEWFPVYEYNWETANWETCSVPCGGGEQTRIVKCRRDTDIVYKPDHYCKTTKPTVSQVCNTAKCFDPSTDCFLSNAKTFYNGTVPQTAILPQKLLFWFIVDDLTKSAMMTMGYVRWRGGWCSVSNLNLYLPDYSITANLDKPCRLIAHNTPSPVLYGNNGWGISYGKKSGCNSSGQIIYHLPLATHINLKEVPADAKNIMIHVYADVYTAPDGHGCFPLQGDGCYNGHCTYGGGALYPRWSYL